MFLSVWSASFGQWAWKWLISIASVISGCILNIVWNRSSKCSKFLILPSKINVFVDTGFSIVAACGCCWVSVPAIASTRWLMEVFESEFSFLGVCWTTGKIMSFYTTVDKFRFCIDWCSRFFKVRPVRNSGIWFVWPVCSVIMWRVWLPIRIPIWDRQFFYPGRNSVSSIIFNTCNVLFLSDTFSGGAVIRMCSQQSEFAITLLASCSDDAFIDP